MSVWVSECVRLYLSEGPVPSQIDAALIWAKAIYTPPSEQARFALNAAVDSLPYNANPVVEEEVWLFVW